jgi:NADPH:quinone reductase-like Zn-dependent oxidoreductase
MGLVGGGAQAEYVVVNQAEAMAVPDRMTYEEAAAIPEAFLTAWDAITRQGRTRAGERVLVHAIGSGVGTAAAQLADVLGVAVIGTSRTPDKIARARELGMEHGVLTTDADWVAQVGGPVHVIIDTLGAEYFDANLSLLDNGGRLVVLGTLTGGVANRIDLGRVLRQRLTVVGTAMRSRSAQERAELVQRFVSDMLPHLDSGQLRAVVDRSVPWTEAAAAYELLGSNATFGKVVLTVE